MGLPATLGDTNDLPALPDDPKAFRGRELTPDEEQRLEAVRLPRAKAWLRGLAMTGRANKASDLVGVSHGLYGYWLKTDPAFRELHDDIRAWIVERANDDAQDKVENGFWEKYYDADGNLKGSRVRQDPGFHRAWLATIDPRWRNDAEKSQSITIVVERTKE